jgi:hypothetical protein
MIMRTARLATLATLLVLAPAVHAEIYKWVDDKGVVNYSSTPPENRKSVTLDEAQGRVSTIETHDVSKRVALAREQMLQQRIARLEEEVARGRQAAALDAAAAAEAERVARELCIAQRRVDCDGPLTASFLEQSWVGFPGSVVKRPRRVPGAYVPTGKVAVGYGGIVGPYFKPPPGGFAAGPGPYGIGAGYQRAWPGGVVVGPGPYGIGAAYHPVPEETGPVRSHPRPRR